MITFLQKRCQMLERINTSSSQETPSNKYNVKQGKNPESKVRATHGEKSKISGNKVNSFATVAKPGKCFLCQGPHFIYLCTKFLSMSVKEHINEVKRLRLCHNCLRNDHFVKTCKMGSCRECSGKHNTLCHRSKDDLAQDTSSDTLIEEPAQISQPSIDATTQVNVTVHHTSTNLRQQTLLATALINVVHANGSLVSCRALLEAGRSHSRIPIEYSDVWSSVRSVSSNKMRHTGGCREQEQIPACIKSSLTRFICRRLINRCGQS